MDLEAAKTAAQDFLDQRAQAANSVTTFVFQSAFEQGNEIILEYRADSSEWVDRTHDLVKVAYTPSTGQIRLIRQ